MSWDIENINKQIQEDLNNISDVANLESFRIKYLGRKGLISQILSNLGNVSSEERPKLGKLANELKQRVLVLIDEKKIQLAQDQDTRGTQVLDFSLPGIFQEIGHEHPVTQVIRQICEIFIKLGFKIIEGPEIETEFNNFTALNIPLEHPSRDGFDTFYLEQPNCPVDKRLLLRSHTSPVQIRVMKKHIPPLAVLVPGKVYRPDAVDASHSFVFHQIEGFFVDRQVRFSDLKGVLVHFAKELFGKDIQMRFRPHFFPFTEPSAEVDISCIICKQQKQKTKNRRCSVCGGKSWLEILGAGMIHPHVFEAVGYPKGKYAGFAFGMGIERIAMLKFGINDIRLFFENDLRFLRQF